MRDYIKDSSQKGLIGVGGQKYQTLSEYFRSEANEEPLLACDGKILRHNLKSAPGFGGGPMYIRS